MDIVENREEKIQARGHVCLLIGIDLRREPERVKQVLYQLLIELGRLTDSTEIALWFPAEEPGFSVRLLSHLSQAKRVTIVVCSDSFQSMFAIKHLSTVLATTLEIMAVTGQRPAILELFSVPRITVVRNVFGQPLRTEYTPAFRPHFLYDETGRLVRY